MRALTVRRPWADAIVQPSDLPKRIENRSRATKVRGELLIHAGLAYDPMGRSVITDWAALDSWPDARGAVIGIAVLAGCHQATEGCCAPWGQPNAWHWELADVRPLAEPIPAKGSLGFWTPPEAVLTAVRRQIEVARA